MPQRLVSVDQTADLPKAVKDRLAQFFPTMAQAETIATAKAGQFVNLNSSPTADANKIVKRNGDGDFEVRDATMGKHPVNLSQLDSRVPAGGYPVATQLVNGLMSTSDKSKLDGATGSNTGGTLVSRFADGSSNFGQVQLLNTPTLANHGATKSYVDTEVGKRALSAHNHDATDLTSGLVPVARLPLATQSANGALSSADKTKLDKASATAVANTLMMTDANGRYQSATPSASADVANKVYVDGKKWDGADITTGTVSPLRIANATNALDGLMPKEDKYKLDMASVSATASTLALRDTNGSVRFNTVFSDSAQSSGVSALTRKDYVDAQVATRATTNHSHSGADITSGVLPLAVLPVHTHSGADITTGTISPDRIANATNALDGLMPKADKSLLDGATGQSTGSAIVRRYSDGTFTTQQISLAGAPTVISHATRKDYVDGQVATRALSSHNHSGSDITSGTIPVAVLPVVTSTTAGLMLASDKVILDSATSVAGANKLIKANASGDIAVNAPTSGSHPSTKTYVDTEVAKRALSDHNHSGADITSGTISPLRIANVTTTVDGLMSAVDKVKLNGASSTSTANTLMMTDANGRFSAVAPTSTLHVANKAYVDGKVWDGADITTGTISPSRIANVTSVLDGLMSKADKVLLDGSTGLSTGSTLVQRTSDGSATFNYVGLDGKSPGASNAVRRDYVDALIAKQVGLMGEIGNIDLNTVIAPGDYYTSTGANATLVNNYPLSGAVGTLEVRRFHSSSVWVVQTYKQWSTNRVWVRSANSATGWTDWSLQASEAYVDSEVSKRALTTHNHSGNQITSGMISTAVLPSVTTTTEGLMPASDKVKLNGATYLATGSTLAQRMSDGQLLVGTPVNSTSATTKTYVDSKTWDGADITAGTISPLRIANATTSLDGLMSKADKSKLDKASSLATANTLMMTDANGRFQVVSPSGATDTANKAYVDAKTWSGSDITSGYISPLRIANATSSIDGLMSKADKTLLDSATATYSTNSLVLRDGAGTVRAGIYYTDQPQSSNGQSLTRKDYVDGEIVFAFTGTALSTSGGTLDTIVKPGVYTQSSNGGASGGTNYPAPYAGLLEVHSSDGGSFVYQRYTPFVASGKIYYRARYNGSWNEWKEVVTTANASQLAYTATTLTSSVISYDNYKTPGSYLIVATSTMGTSILLEVFAEGNGRLMQRKTTNAGSTITVRWYTGSTWTGWQA